MVGMHAYIHAASASGGVGGRHFCMQASLYSSMSCIGHAYDAYIFIHLYEVIHIKLDLIEMYKYLSFICIRSSSYSSELYRSCI